VSALQSHHHRRHDAQLASALIIAEGQASRVFRENLPNRLFIEIRNEAGSGTGINRPVKSKSVLCVTCLK
jgi:hypothetical protein